MAAYSRDTWLTTFQTHGVDTSRMSSPRPIVALHPRHKLHPLTRHPGVAEASGSRRGAHKFRKTRPGFRAPDKRSAGDRGRDVTHPLPPTRNHCRVRDHAANEEARKYVVPTMVPHSRKFRGPELDR